MPAVGCNYSEPLLNLLNQGAVEVDWIKLSRWDAFAEEFASARPLRPVLLHVLPRAGMRPSAFPWDDWNAAAAACGSPHVALHHYSTPDDWDSPPTDAEVVERMVAMTGLFAERLNQPLLVENVPYYGFKGALRATVEAGTIREVCDRTGAGLLLDLAHARVAAAHLGADVRAYLAAMPLDRVREIHVCGPAFDPERGYFRDMHLEMQEEDYSLLEWALARTAPLAVTLEYGGTGPKMAWRNDPAALERQLVRLRSMVKGAL